MVKDDITSIIVKMLKQTDAQQIAAIRQFSKLPMRDKIHIFSNHRKIFYDLKQKNANVEVSTLSYIAFIKAISKYIATEDNRTKINISKIAIGLKRARLKSDILLERWSLVKELRSEHKLSFREIAAYLKKFHKIKIAHSTIYQMWKKLEKKNEKNG